MRVTLRPGILHPAHVGISFYNDTEHVEYLAKPRFGFNSDLDGAYFRFSPVRSTHLPESAPDRYAPVALLPVDPGVEVINVIDLRRYFDLNAHGSFAVSYAATHPLDGPANPYRFVAADTIGIDLS